MQGWKNALYFVMVDGSLLFGLFVLITYLVYLAQQFAVGRNVRGTLTSGEAGSWRGAVLAAFGGAVTPFCSCSTVPVLSGMLRAGVPLSACFTFLIASPVINEGVIILLAGSSGTLEAVVYIAVAGMMCVIAGILVEQAGFHQYLRPSSVLDLPLPDGNLSGTQRVRPPIAFAIGNAWAGTRMELRHLGPYLALGILVGALIYGYVPTGVLAELASSLSPTVMIVIAALIAAPLYISPLVAVPIGFALIEKGIGIGPVMAFLIAGAGTSLPEMILLRRMFHWPLLAAHITTVILAAWVLGFTAYWTLDRL